MRTRLTQLLELELPLIQAPMAGVSTPQLAAAVSNAGALGSVAVGAMDAASAQVAIVETMTLTDRPICVNVFVHQPPRRDAQIEARWLAALAPVFARFDASPPAQLREIYRSFLDNAAMLEMLLATRPAAVSSTSGYHNRRRSRHSKQTARYCWRAQRRLRKRAWWKRRELT